LVFLSHGALELGELMLKVLEEEKTPEQWKLARIFPLFKKGKKEKTVTN